MSDYTKYQFRNSVSYVPRPRRVRWLPVVLAAAVGAGVLAVGVGLWVGSKI